MTLLRPLARAVPLLSLLPAACGGPPPGPVDGGRAMAHVERLVSFAPRHAGSEGAARAARYLRDRIAEMGVEVRIQEWEDPDEKITLRNVVAEIPGADPEEGPILAFGSHYDSKKTTGHDDPDHNFEFVGAIDGGGSNGVLLELIRACKDRDNRANLMFLFFDGEESVEFHWNEDRALLGSRHFVASLPTGERRRIKAFVLLDLIGDAQIKFDRDRLSDKPLQDLFMETAKELGIEDRMYRHESQVGDDHESFLNYGIPSMVLIDFKYRVPGHLGGEPLPEGTDYQRWWHSPEDTLDKMSADALALTGNLVWAALPRLEEKVLEDS